MKLRKVIAVLMLLTTSLTAKIIIPDHLVLAYKDAKKRARLYNRTLEADGIYLACQQDDDDKTVIYAKKLYHKIIKIDTFTFSVPTTCKIENGKLMFNIEVKKSLFDQIWTPTTAFFSGILVGALVIFGISNIK